MAEANLEPAGTPSTPWVVSPARAALPLRNGRVQFHDLSAPAPSQVAFDAEPAWQWVRYQARETAEPAATLSAGVLELAAGGIAVTVGLPAGLAVSATVADTAPARLARIYSLVVNCRGDANAKCLVVAEVGTEWFQRLDPCEVMTISREAAPAEGGRFLSAGARLLVA